MQTSKPILSTTSMMLKTAASLHRSQSDRTSEASIAPDTLAILAEIAAVRDYYESGGRW